MDADHVEDHTTLLGSAILAKLFSYLSGPVYYSRDNLSCSLVNKWWRRVSLELFTWYPVFEANLCRNSPLLNPKEERDIIANIQTITGSNPTIRVVTDKEDEDLNTIKWKFTGESVTNFLHKYINFVNSDEPKQHQGLWRNFGLISNYQKIKIVCLINIPMLKQIARSDCVGSDSFLWKYLTCSIEDNAFAEDMLKKLSEIREINRIQEISQPQGLKKNFLLSSFQLHDVAWMMEIENSERRVEHYGGTVVRQTLHGNLYFDTERKILATREELEKYNKKYFHAKGGVVASDKTIGRKVELIGLLLANSNKLNENIQQLNPTLTYTGATLILCNPLEMKEWRKVIDEMTDPPLKVLAFEFAANISFLVQEDFVSADVVIVGLDSSLVRAHTNKKTISLTQFLWNRVVLFNSHYLLHQTHGSINLYNRIISKIVAGVYWCITHDMFYNSEVIANTMQLLGFPQQCLYDFLSKFVRKTTHKNISVNHNSKFVYEEVPVVPLSHLDLEQAHYPQIPEAELSLDQKRLQKIPLLKSWLKAAIARRYTLPNHVIEGKLQDYDEICSIQDIYSGPILNLSTCMPNVSDDKLSKKINEKRDLDDKDLYKTNQEECKFIKSAYTRYNPPSSKTLLTFFKSKPNKETETPKEDMFAFLHNMFGQKIAVLLFRLKEIWEEDPSARVLIVSFSTVQLYHIFNKMGITAGFVMPVFSGSRVPIWTHKNSTFPFRVLLFTTTYYRVTLKPCVSFSVSHIFSLGEIVQNPADLLDHEKRLFSSIYPQGDRKDIKVVRIFWKDKHEHEQLFGMNMVSTSHERRTRSIYPESPAGKLLIKSGITATSFQYKNIITWPT